MNPPFLMQKPSWIARLLLTLTTVALVIAGFFFLTVALVAGALIALVISVRLWWVMRKIKRAHADLRAAASASEKSVVDGEYQVLERESTAPQLPAARPDAPGHIDTESPPHREIKS